LDVKIKTALISVSDKSGLEEIVRSLEEHGVKIVSTGGTAKAIAEMGVDVMDVSALTNFPEMMDGRVKTLHPKVHGGLLAKRDDKDHVQSQKEHGIEDIDLIIVNLYPFEETINTQENEEICIENIDIGGPAMLRSAAKNHKFVTVVTDVNDYSDVINEMKENKGSTTLDFRKKLAAKTFSMTAYYDSMISNWFHRDQSDQVNNFSSAGKLSSTLRYGENPHQSAGLYKSSQHQSGIPYATLLQGKELSYNNINDSDAALQLIKEFDQNVPTVAIIKHANPCGVASANSLSDAYVKAFSCDTTSAFGGIIATNQIIDEDTAKEIIKIFTEVIIAPGISDEAEKIFKTKNNLRILVLPSLHEKHISQNFKSIEGGILVQSGDIKQTKKSDLKIVTQKEPTDDQMNDMLFAFKVCKHVKSNAIIYVKNQKTIGIGAGQMSRVDSAKIASQKNSEMENNDENSLKDSVVASDAFFPFSDGLLVTISSGATAVIQPGGSIKDDEVIKAADNAGISMVFTGVRHFRH
jgi:phosphoribosylaminoimidazolecarboxamide formyltransferase/IMP cyclohydrolase